MKNKNGSQIGRKQGKQFSYDCALNFQERGMKMDPGRGRRRPCRAQNCDP